MDNLEAKQAARDLLRYLDPGEPEGEWAAIVVNRAEELERELDAAEARERQARRWIRRLTSTAGSVDYAGKLMHAYAGDGLREHWNNLQRDARIWLDEHKIDHAALDAALKQARAEGYRKAHSEVVLAFDNRGWNASADKDISDVGQLVDMVCASVEDNEWAEGQADGAAHVAKARQWIERAQRRLTYDEYDAALDLVVLAVGMEPRAGAGKVSQLLNEALVELNLAEGKEPYEGLGRLEQ